MNEKDLMMGVLTKFFNKTEDEISDLIYGKDGEDVVLKEDAAEALISLDEARVKRLRDESGEGATKKFDEGYKKAQKEVLTRFEKDIREKFGVESDKSGIDLVADVVSGASKGDKITLDKIKTHPDFLKIEKEWADVKEKELASVREEFESFKNSIEHSKVMENVRSAAKKEFLKLNPVLSQDPAKAESQTELFLSGFNKYGYDLVGDDIIVKNGDTRLEDKHGNPVKFSSFVKEKADELFDFRKQEDRESPGNRTGGAGTKTVLTKTEYNKLVNEAGDDHEKLVEIGQKYSYE
jgi:hypothetical protein